MHGFLSRDGMSPLEFLQISRDQLRRYDGVEFRHIKVVDLQRSDDAFEAVLENGERVQSRTVLLATGLLDDCPKLEGFSRFYGRTIHHCPYCDGWEHRDQPVAVYGSTHHAVELAIEVRHWSKDIVLCSGGPPQFARKERAALKALHIPILEEKITRLEGNDDQLAGIRFSNGTFLARRALFFSPGQQQRSPLAEKLGCKLDEEGCVKCSEKTATDVPGVFVAGNASTGLQLVIIAAAEGTEAAFAINQALLDIEYREARCA